MIDSSLRVAEVAGEADLAPLHRIAQVGHAGAQGLAVGPALLEVAVAPAASGAVAGLAGDAVLTAPCTLPISPVTTTAATVPSTLPRVEHLLARSDRERQLAGLRHERRLGHHQLALLIAEDGVGEVVGALQKYVGESLFLGVSRRGQPRGAGAADDEIERRGCHGQFVFAFLGWSIASLSPPLRSQVELDG